MAAAERKEEVRYAQPVQSGRMRPSETGHAMWDLYVTEDVTVRDLENPDFWSLCAERFTSNYDEVRVISDEGSWFARCMVLQATRLWAKVKVLEHHILNTPAPLPDSELYECAWKGPHNKWVVIRKADGAYIKKQLLTREEASTWMREHEKAQAASRNL